LYFLFSLLSFVMNIFISGFMYTELDYMQDLTL
jgi:hypothetical protein